MNCYNSITNNNKHIEIMESHDKADPNWDNFLNSVSFAEFEQSSLWVPGKIEDGWKPVRYKFLYGDKIIGGYQILIKEMNFSIKFGYVIKGPTYLPEYSSFADFIIEHLIKTARELKCHLLLLQPPFISPEIETYLENKHFLYESFLNIIEVSVAIDLENKTSVELLAALKAKRRQNLNKAEKSLLTFIEGKSTDLNCFFELMKITCKRNNVVPNPGSFVKLQKIWESFASKGFIKLFFVEMKGEKICGIIVIIFGNKVNLWKFGWTGKYANLHPNEYLYWKIIEWSLQNEYYFCDFLGTSKAYLPDNYNTCTKIPVNNVNGNNDLKLSFGGYLIVLPKVRIIFYNKVFHFAYIVLSFLGKVFPQMLLKLKKKVMYN